MNIVIILILIPNLNIAMQNFSTNQSYSLKCHRAVQYLNFKKDEDQKVFTSLEQNTFKVLGNFLIDQAAFFTNTKSFKHRNHHDHHDHRHDDDLDQHNHQQEPDQMLHQTT